MTPHLLNKIGQLLWGARWKEECAKALKQSVRTVKRKAKGESIITTQDTVQLSRELARKYRQIGKMIEALK